MPSFSIAQSVPANGTALPLSGSLYEYIPFNATIEFAMVQASGAVGAVLATVNSGPDTLMEEGAISAAARYPVYPDDYSLTDQVAQGDRIKIQLRNTTGGIIIVNVVLKITPF